ncbi:hypothetical protein [Cellulomonas sp. SG140]|uniref:hypothetical protein n=1 Tax=Cellulomonas sp. SG140 TaxID=2976536 RepID=UPI0021E756F3|nr:hypothetical protein [Cellulomonas sp. SG140]
MTLLPNSDGTVSLVTEVAPGLTVIRGTVDSPWAVDSKGNQVPTSYRVVGHSLVQAIRPLADTVYPVVADPKLTFGMGAYLNMSGAEWKSWAYIVGSSLVFGSTYVCMRFGNTIIGQACTLIGVPTGISTFLDMVASVGAWSLDPVACYQNRILPENNRVTRVALSNCQ